MGRALAQIGVRYAWKKDVEVVHAVMLSIRGDERKDTHGGTRAQNRSVFDGTRCIVMFKVEQRPDFRLYQVEEASVNLLMVKPMTLVIQQRHSTVSDYFLSIKEAVSEANAQTGPRCKGCERSLTTNRGLGISEKPGIFSLRA